MMEWTNIEDEYPPRNTRIRVQGQFGFNFQKLEHFDTIGRVVKDEIGTRFIEFENGEKHWLGYAFISRWKLEE